jgi:uncharacterized protein
MAQRNRSPQQWMWRFLAATLLISVGASADAQFLSKQSSEPVVTGETKNDTSALEEARKLMDLINVKQMTQQTIQQINQMIMPMVKNSNPGKEKEIESLYNEFFIPEINSHIDEVLDDVTKLYSLHFTQAEIQDMIQFYQTETGRKMIAEQPLIFQQSHVIAQAWSQRIVRIALEKFSVEAAKRGLKPLHGT